MEAHLLATVAQLTSLRSLHLSTGLKEGTWSPEALRPYATCVARLSTLTALTQLQLQPPYGFFNQGDSWLSMVQDPNQHLRAEEVWTAHQISLMSALRCMPLLASLTAPSLWLRPYEMAQLTALTSIAVGGLLPAAGHPSEAAQGAAASGAALPAHLQELTLQAGASPRALAALKPREAFARLNMHTMRFGKLDVTPGGQLRAETAAAVGPAVRLLTAYRGRTPQSAVFSITADAGRSALVPPEGAANGHMEWIRQLHGLSDRYRAVSLERVALGPGDLSCLGEALRDLKSKRHVCTGRVAHQHRAACCVLRGV